MPVQYIEYQAKTVENADHRSAHVHSGELQSRNHIRLDPIVFNCDNVGLLNGILSRLLCVPVIVVSAFRQFFCFSPVPGCPDLQAQYSIAKAAPESTSTLLAIFVSIIHSKGFLCVLSGPDGTS